MRDNIVRIGVIFIFYLFVVIMSYYVMSTPVNMLFDGFDAADFGEAEDEMNTHLPNYRTAFTIAMAILLALPITWFVMKIFSREPDIYQYRRF